MPNTEDEPRVLLHTSDTCEHYHQWMTVCVWRLQCFFVPYSMYMDGFWWVIPHCCVVLYHSLCSRCFTSPAAVLGCWCSSQLPADQSHRWTGCMTGSLHSMLCSRPYACDPAHEHIEKKYCFNAASLVDWFLKSRQTGQGIITLSETLSISDTLAAMHFRSTL